MRTKAILLITLLAVVATGVFFLFRQEDKQDRPPTRQYPSYTVIEVGLTELGDPRFLPIYVNRGGKWWIRSRYSCVASSLGIADSCVRAKYLHAIIVAKDPLGSHDYYFRAGPNEERSASRYSSRATLSSSSRAKCPLDENGKLLLCAIAEHLTERSVDRLSEVIASSRVAVLQLPFPQVVEKMNNYADWLTSQRIRYKARTLNSNTAASRILTWLGIDPIRVHRVTDNFLVPGWELNDGIKYGSFDVLNTVAT